MPGHRLMQAEARFYAAGVALALEYLHASGVIYRCVLCRYMHDTIARVMSLFDESRRLAKP